MPGVPLHQSSGSRLLPDAYDGWIPATASYPGCGGLAPYMFGAALAHAQVFDFVAYHGRSGGAIAAALLAARAPLDTILAVCDRWDPRIALRETDVRGWRGMIDLRGRGNVQALQDFLHEQLDELGFATFGDFRYAKRPPGIDFDHRMQIGLCYVDIPARRVAEYKADTATFLQAILAARSQIKSMVFPRDAHLLPHLKGNVDDQSVAEWLVHSSRHPAQFRPSAFPLADGGLRVVFDGAVRCKELFLFDSKNRPPHPMVTFRHDEVKVMDQQRFDDVRQHPWALVDRGKPPCRSFDIPRLVENRHRLVERGYVDCARSMETTLGPYLEQFEVNAPLRALDAPHQPTYAERLTPLIRAAGVRLETARAQTTRVAAAVAAIAASAATYAHPVHAQRSTEPSAMADLSIGLEQLGSSTPF